MILPNSEFTLWKVKAAIDAYYLLGVAITSHNH